MQPGDLLDLGATAPAECVTWADDGSCWMTRRRTDLEPRREGTVVYEVVAPVDDREVVSPVELVRQTFGEVSEVDPFDVTVLRGHATRLLAYYRDHDPDLVADAVWRRLDAAVGGDVSGELVAASAGVVAWCRLMSPTRLERKGWRALIEQLEAHQVSHGT